MRGRTRVIVASGEGTGLGSGGLGATSLLTKGFGTVVFSPSSLGLVSRKPDMEHHFLSATVKRVCPDCVGLLGDCLETITRHGGVVGSCHCSDALSVVLSIFRRRVTSGTRGVGGCEGLCLRDLGRFLPGICSNVYDNERALAAGCVCSFDNSFGRTLGGDHRRSVCAKMATVNPRHSSVSFGVGKISTQGCNSRNRGHDITLTMGLSRTRMVGGGINR